MPTDKANSEKIAKRIELSIQKASLAISGVTIAITAIRMTVGPWT
jgi:hypothetical protein